VATSQSVMSNFMRSFARTLILALTFAAVLTGSAFGGSLTEPSGYRCVDTTLDAQTLPSNGWFGGFDLLPNGNLAIHNGFAIVESTRAGQYVRTIYDYGQRVWGSFVRYNPYNGKLYFGDSSQNKIKSISLTGGPAADLATLSGNFDLDFWHNQPMAVAGNNIYLINESTGQCTQIATAGVNSGPLVIDSLSGLIYGTGTSSWPPQQNTENIYRWTDSQIQSAIQSGTPLTVSEASVLVANTDGPYGFAFNGNNELMLTDTVVSPGEIRLVRNGQVQTFSTAQVPGQNPYPTVLRYDKQSGEILTVVSYMDEYWNTYSRLSTLVPVPEPSSVGALCTLFGLAGSLKLLRCRRK